MRYLDLIKPYQSVDLSNHLPFYIGNERTGWIQKPFAEHLKQFTDVFICGDERVILSETLTGFNTRSAAIKTVLSHLANQGVVKRNPFGSHNPSPAFQKPDILPVGSEPFSNPLLGIERYYSNLFGIPRHNISVVGYTDDHVWIAQRSDKVEHPNKLDHMVSGCCTVEHDILGTVADESYDEAGFTQELIQQIKPLSTYHVINNDRNGDVFHELVNLFEISLPNDYQPQTNQLDEIVGFELFSIDELKDEILNKDNLLGFSKIILIYFLIKHKYITEKHKEYDDLIKVFNYDPALEIAAY